MPLPGPPSRYAREMPLRANARMRPISDCSSGLKTKKFLCGESSISVETGKTMWKYEQRAATTSLVATGGRLLFGGDANGRFRAFDQETGKVLWEVNLGSAVTGYPIAYASGGRQYIAVSTGGSLATGGLNGLTPELRPGASNTLFVFALPAN